MSDPLAKSRDAAFAGFAPPQPNRLSAGGEIDRARPLSFRFDGRLLSGYRGDSLASALLANDVGLVGRSFKYHRPRGLWGAGVEEANAYVAIAAAGCHDPQIKATLVPLTEGLEARSLHAWPSLAFDLYGAFDRLHRFLSAGFYYKTFMRPSWGAHEDRIRRLAGMGAIQHPAADALYETRHDHCDLLIVGAGPAGLAAARAAAAAGLKTVLCEQRGRLGGSLLWDAGAIDGKSGAAWAAETERDLRSSGKVTILTDSTAFGYFDHNMIGLIERRAAAPAGWAPERIWKLRARRVILATGAIERPLVIPNNDRPGVMSAAAAAEYLGRYAVLAGRRIALATNNDAAYRSALALRHAGAAVTILDLRARPSAAAQAAAKAAGIELLAGRLPVDVVGKRRLRAIRHSAYGADGVEGRGAARLDCDLLLLSGGFSPTVHLFSQSGGKLRYDEKLAAFLPDRSVQAERSVGAAQGVFDLSAALADGHEAALAAAQDLGRSSAIAAPKAEGVTESYRVEAFWYLPQAKGRQWVDFHNDVTVGDVRLAARENYISVEHLKRYTTLGMAPDQGKTSNVNGLAILAAETGRAIPAVGTTSFRPPYDPVSLGALAGQRQGKLHSPIRHLPTHRAQSEDGAVFDDYGGWRRAAYFARAAETRAAAIRREVLALRNGAGLFDGSPLGKIEVAGPDAAKFLNLIYYNEVANLKPGKIRYCLALNENGKVFDDGVVARFAEDRFLLSPSSSHAAAFHAMLEEWRQCEYLNLNLAIENLTTAWATFAIAGPRARQILAGLESDIDLSPAALPFMSLAEGRIGGVPARVARVSFTGESSFEVSVPAGYGPALYKRLLEIGRPVGLTPIGMEAILILRAEKGYILIGRDTDGTTEPQDLGMVGPLKNKKIDFVGRRSLFRTDSQRDDRRQFVGLLAEDPETVLPTGAHGIDRQAGKARSIGYVTSSYFSPTLGRSIALGQIERGQALQKAGAIIEIFDRGRTYRARVVSPIFYDPEGRKLHD